MDNFDWIWAVTWVDGLVALGIFLIFFALRKLFTKFIMKAIAYFSKRSKNKIDDALLEAFQKPIAFFLLITGLFLAVTYLPIQPDWEMVVSVLYKSITIFSVGWGLFVFSDAISLFFEHAGTRFDLKFNEIMIPFLSRIIKFIVAVLTISLILEQWNFHVSGLIAGLGIGGLAVAMAAKDTLSNFFGGMVIITDAPFTIGDLIQSENIEGIVEDINFRSTRIRTVDQALVTVPNSTLANQPITNLSKMGKRRISFTIPLDLETPNEQLKNCVNRIRRLLTEDTDVHDDGILVFLDKITSTSIDLMIQFYIRTIDFEEWLRIKEKFNFVFLEIFADEGVNLATVRSQMVFNSQKNTGELAGKTDQARMKSRASDPQPGDRTERKRNH